MGASRTRVQGGREVVVRRRAGHDMSKEEWLILLHFTTVRMVAYVSCDGLTGGRDAVAEARYIRTGAANGKGRKQDIVRTSDT